MNTLERLKQVFETTFAVSLPDFGINVSPENLEAWDSAAHVELLLAIENEFSVQFTAEELNDCDRVGVICSIIDAKLKIAHVRV